MKYEKKLILKNKADKVKFQFRRAKKYISRNPYIKADDIRQVGKTTMLIKQAGKSPNNLIVVPTVRQKQCIEHMCELILKDKHPKNMPRIVALYRLTRDDFKYARNVFVEEPMDKIDILKLNKCAGNFKHKIKLSYVPLD